MKGNSTKDAAMNDDSVNRMPHRLKHGLPHGIGESLGSLVGLALIQACRLAGIENVWLGMAFFAGCCGIGAFLGRKTLSSASS